MKFTQFVKEYLVKNKDSGLTYREAMKDDGVRCAYKQFEADLCKAGIVRETEERPVAKRKYVKKPKVIEENITINENAPVAAPAQPQRQTSAPAKIGYTPPPRTAPPRQVQPQQARVPSEDPFYQANPLLAQRAEEAIKQYNEMMGKKTAEVPAPSLRQKKSVTINPETDVFAEPAERLDGGIEGATRPQEPDNFESGAPALSSVPQGRPGPFQGPAPAPAPVQGPAPAPSFSRPSVGRRRTVGGPDPVPVQLRSFPNKYEPVKETRTALDTEPTTYDPVPLPVLQRDPQPYGYVDGNVPVMPGPEPYSDASLDRRRIEYRPDEPTEDPVERVDAGVEAGVQTSIPPAPPPARPAAADAGNQTDYYFSAGNQTPVRRSQFPPRRSARRTTPSATTDLNNVRNDIVELAVNGEIRPSDVENLNRELYVVEEQLDSDEVSLLTSILAEDLQADPYNTPIPEGSVSPEGSDREGSVNSANVYEQGVNDLGYRHFLDNRSQFGGVNPANDRGTTQVSDYHTGQGEEVGGDNPLFRPGSVKREVEAIEKRIDESKMTRGEILNELTDIVTDPRTGKRKAAYKSVKLNGKKNDLKKRLAEVSTQERRSDQGTQERVNQFAQLLEDEEGKVDDRNVVSVAGESGEISPRPDKRGRENVEERSGKRLNVIREEEEDEEEYRRYMADLPEGQQLAMRYDQLPEELQRYIKGYMDRDEFAPPTNEELREAKKRIAEGTDSLMHLGPKRRRLYDIITELKKPIKAMSLDELMALSPEQRADLIKKTRKPETYTEFLARQRDDADSAGSGLTKTDKLKKIMHALIDVSL